MCCHQNKPSFMCFYGIFHVLLCDNILHMPKEMYTTSAIANQSCCRLCSSAKDVSRCKNLFKKANEQLLTTAEADFGGTLQRKYLRPHLVSWPSEWQITCLTFRLTLE